MVTDCFPMYNFELMTFYLSFLQQFLITLQKKTCDIKSIIKMLIESGSHNNKKVVERCFYFIIRDSLCSLQKRNNMHIIH